MQRQPGSRKMVGYPGLEKQADVGQLLVARSIDTRLALRDQILPRAFGRHDHGMAAALHASEQMVEQAAGACEGERHLWDQHVVGIRLGERGVAGDEA